MSSMTSSTWDLLSLIPLLSTWRSTSASVKQLRPCPVWQSKYGPTTSWLSTPKSRSTEPVSWALLYGSAWWTLRARQENKFNVFHMHCIRRILHITWQDIVKNKSVLERAGIHSMYSLLKQRRIRLLGHGVRMDDAGQDPQRSPLRWAGTRQTPSTSNLNCNTKMSTKGT